MKAIVLIVGVVISTSAFASPQADQLIAEFEWLKSWAENAEPDGKIGSLYPYVQHDGYVVMFSEEFDGKHDVVRFLVQREAPVKDFAISYYWSKYIVEGRVVLRRFVGTEPTGWKNHTVDVNTREYLGSQGRRVLNLSDDEKELLQDWGIQQL